MMKTLYNTITLDGYTVKYYLTSETTSGLSYYGFMLTSEYDEISYSSHISGIFPYKNNAVTLLTYLFDHNVTPLSMKDAVMEYMDEKFVTC